MNYLSIRAIVPGIVLAIVASGACAQGEPSTQKKVKAPAASEKLTKTAPPQEVLEAAAVSAAPEFHTLMADKSYRVALTRWLAEAPTKGKRWQLSWELAEADYEFDYEGEFGPDLVKAVDGLCGALNASGVHARAYFYEGSRVVRLVMQGAQR
jgi:hypothetical protein